MKFNFFHLMPYPYLPEDFDDVEKYPSMSLTFSNGNFDPAKGVDLYHRYLDELEYADELGFDGIVVNEHHQSGYGMMPSPNVMAAALARRTSRSTIMVLGNAIPIRGNPLRVAEEIAMLDHLTRGRLVSGFVRGIGWEHYAHGVSPADSRSRFNEAHDLIKKAWTTDGPFQWIGEHYEYRYVNVWPRPLQSPHPPIAVPGAGSPETMRWVAENHYMYVSVYAPTKVVKTWFDGYRKAAADLGYEPDPDNIALATPVFIGESDRSAMREAKQHVEWLFHKGLRQGSEIVFPPGYMSAPAMRGLLKAGMKPYPELSFSELVELGYVIVGGPESVRNRIGELRDELGFGQMMTMLAIGDMPAEMTRRNTEIFATEVMPHFRPEESSAGTGGGLQEAARGQAIPRPSVALSGDQVSTEGPEEKSA
ncbi:LLM class flavin-dependent oxidoreductase [Pseudonocardia parietis]|uniref:Alkanesulfonate monooxygenase SsuD/methylene tetrahydromethanopterin reductase-like flavin-dependent oxidoreductase (Luciferase family) n=1 Tax=Pseudonocardia parietis TaxID=570936 RepID=A0ABS4VMN9_9PSEU|nr:LLM class flavin-dependent oxidoreductase [Pseudonocardia parietis]MBP2365177.1 alkanesulfonate monooxygenase SsuD/methylene tetrahydromethanopterin reductase-like flavin-dependent oxidoreductase (luciferase family) [Pseudonocardia parietis]